MKRVVFTLFVFLLLVTPSAIYAWDVTTIQPHPSIFVRGQEQQPTDIAFNTDGTKMFVLGQAGRDVNEYTLSTGFDPSTASFVDSFSVSTEDTIPVGLAFNADGTKMFVAGEAGDDINEYTLSTGFDVSTASFVDSFSVAGQDTFIEDVTFSPDGTKMYVAGRLSSGRIYEYTLSTGFDVSTASYVRTFGVSAQETEPRGVLFNTDGTKMFVIGQSGDDINEYTLSTGFNISTASFVDRFVIGDQEIFPEGMAFNNTGDELFVVGEISDTVFKYELGTAFDISTTVENASYRVGSQDGCPYAIAFNTTGTKMFMVGCSSDSVNEYTLSIGFEVSTASFVDATSIAAQDGDPHGLDFNTDGTKMFVLGDAGDDVNEYILSTGFDASTASFVDSFSVAGQESFPNGLAFNSDGTKMFVTGSAGDDINEYTLSTGFDVSTASFVDSFSVVSEETSPYSVSFNGDGTKMFVVGIDSDSLHEYDLSTGFDVSTASYSGNSFSLSNKTSQPRDITFNNDGTKMYLVAGLLDTIFQYTVNLDSTPPTLSSISASVSSTQATTTWTTDEDASTRVAYGLSSTYSQYTTETDTSPRVTAHSKTLSNLANCTTYHYAVYSADAVGNAATSTDQTFTTEGCTGSAPVTRESSAAVATTTGGSANLAEGDSNIELTLPAGYNEDDTTIQIKQIDQETVLATTGMSVGGVSKQTVGNHTYNLMSYDTPTTTVSTFDQPITITITYQEHERSYAPDESTYRIYRWTGSQWSELSNCTVDIALNTVSCTTTSFSTFALFGTPASGGSKTDPYIENRYGTDDEEEDTTDEDTDEEETTEPEDTSTEPLNLDIPQSDLQRGDTSEDVRKLQTILNTLGYTLATTGAGSPGSETTFFGPLTARALLQLQQDNAEEILAPIGLTQATGYYGRMTRGYLESL